MDLRNEKRISTPECFVCRFAGRHITLWPQQFEAGGHEVKCFVKVEEFVLDTDAMQMRSKHRALPVCELHYRTLYSNFIDIAAEEVRLEEQWNAYVERIE